MFYLELPFRLTCPIVEANFWDRDALKFKDEN
jgi:hypothetical protein